MKLSPADKLALYARAGRNLLGLLGSTTYPPAILWVLTQRCFYQCIHCDSWLDERPIDAAALLAVAEKIARAPTKFVALSGGEPFMVKSLRAIATTLKAAGKVLSINTNGHLLADHVDWLVGAAVDHVQISIDGPDAALHDHIRRQPGSFDRILDGIGRLKAARRDGTPQIGVCGVVMPENVGRLVEFVERFAAVADAVELQPLHDSAGLLATSDASRFGPEHEAQVREQIDALAAGFPAFANGFYRQFPRFLFDAPSMKGAAVDHCFPMIFNTLTIREDGACRICRYPLGSNIHRQSIAEVWNSAARRDLLRSLARSGCTDPCWTRCHIHPSPLPGKVLRRAVAWTGA